MSKPMRFFFLHRNSSGPGHDEGATAIEFAIVAPVLFLILIGILELGMVFFTYTILEGATNIGSRIGKTGYTEGGLSRTDFIRTRIEQLSAGLLKPEDIGIETLSYGTFENIGQAEPCNVDACTEGSPPDDFTDVNGDGQWNPDQGAASAGGAGSVVLYRVSYPWELLTPMFRQLLGDDNGVITIHAVATVRNEAF